MAVEVAIVGSYARHWPWNPLLNGRYSPAQHLSTACAPLSEPSGVGNTLRPTGLILAHHLRPSPRLLNSAFNRNPYTGANTRATMNNSKVMKAQRCPYYSPCHTPGQLLALIKSTNKNSHFSGLGINGKIDLEASSEENDAAIPWTS